MKRYETFKKTLGLDTRAAIIAALCDWPNDRALKYKEFKELIMSFGMPESTIEDFLNRKKGLAWIAEKGFIDLKKVQEQYILRLNSKGRELAKKICDLMEGLNPSSSQL